MKKLLIAAGALAMIASTAQAQSQRPHTQNMLCSDAKALVARRGAVVLYTGEDLYDRYVRDQGFCEREQTIQPARVPTRDWAQCFVGYRCVFNTNDRGIIPQR
jgi:hypothetical protein